jgi:hypothetical protein
VCVCGGGICIRHVRKLPCQKQEVVLAQTLTLAPTPTTIASPHTLAPIPTLVLAPASPCTLTAWYRRTITCTAQVHTFAHTHLPAPHPFGPSGDGESVAMFGHLMLPSSFVKRNAPAAAGFVVSFCMPHTPSPEATANEVTRRLTFEVPGNPAGALPVPNTKSAVAGDGSSLPCGGRQRGLCGGGYNRVGAPRDVCERMLQAIDHLRSVVGGPGKVSTSGIAVSSWQIFARWL